MNKYLPSLWQQGEMMRLLGWNCTIWWLNQKKLNFWFCPQSTINLMASRPDMPHMHRFSIGSMKNQHDAILQSFGTTVEIIISLTRLPSNNQSPVFSYLFFLPQFNSELSSFLCSCQLAFSFQFKFCDSVADSSNPKLFEAKFWRSCKPLIIENILSRSRN